MRTQSRPAIFSRETVDSCVRSWAASVASAPDSPSMRPVSVSHSWSQSRSVVIRVLITFHPAISNLSARVSLNAPRPGCSTYRAPSAEPIRPRRSRSRMPLRAKTETRSAYSAANPCSLSRLMVS
jgi:hypothetical protein